MIQLKKVVAIYSYLTFNGNCREAMLFYKKCLGGELIFETVGEWDISKKMPAKMKRCIVQATLCNKAFTLMGTDMVGEKGLLKGNAVSMMLNCRSEKELKDTYKKLSQAGEKTHPLEETFWDAVFGGLTDKYGNQWLLNYARKQKNKVRK